MIEIDAPDIYGSTIFCDEIRAEANNGKFIYVGVYQGGMFIHPEFPVKLPRLAFAVTLAQRDEIFSAQIGLCIFLPGDPDDAPSIQAGVEETAAGSMKANAANLADMVKVPISERKYIATYANLSFESIEIKEPGIIKVRADIGGKRYRLGSLRILPFPKP